MATKRTSKTGTTKKTAKKRASTRPSKRSSKAPPKRTTKAPKASASKRKSKSPSKRPSASKASTNGAASNGAAKAAKKDKAAPKRTTRAPAKKRSKRSTRPAKLKASAKRTGAKAPRPARVPDVVTVTAPLTDAPPISFEPPPAPPRPEPEPWAPSHDPGPEPQGTQRESYLDGMPQDHAEVLAGFLRVVKAAAGDIRTLIVQAIALSNQRRDRFDR